MVDLIKQIQKNCNKLQFRGLMTIGALARSLQSDENEDFDCLVNCRTQVSEQLNIDLKEVGYYFVNFDT